MSSREIFWMLEGPRRKNEKSFESTETTNWLKMGKLKIFFSLKNCFFGLKIFFFPASKTFQNFLKQTFLSYSSFCFLLLNFWKQPFIYLKNTLWKIKTNSLLNIEVVFFSIFFVSLITNIKKNNEHIFKQLQKNILFIFQYWC